MRETRAKIGSNVLLCSELLNILGAVFKTGRSEVKIGLGLHREARYRRTPISLIAKPLKNDNETNRLGKFMVI